MFKFEWVFSATLICLLILDGHDVLCSHATHVVLCYRKWWDSLAACHGFTWVRKIFCSLSQWSLCLLCPRSSFFFKWNEWIKLISLSVALYKQLVPGSCCIRKDKTSFIPFHPAFFTIYVSLETKHIYIRGACSGFPEGISSFVLVDRNATTLGKGLIFLFASIFYLFWWGMYSHSRLDMQIIESCLFWED